MLFFAVSVIMYVRMKPSNKTGRKINMELTKENMKKIALLIVFAVTFYIGLKNLYLIPSLVYSFGSIVSPVVLGLVFAFILNVLVIQVETRMFSALNRRFTKVWPKIRRPLSIFLSIIIILGIIALFLLIVVPELVRTITNLTQQIPTFLNGLQVNLTHLEKVYPVIGDYAKNIKIDWVSMNQMLAQYAQKFASALVDSTVTVTTNIFHGAMTLVLSIVIALNILLQKEKLQVQMKRILRAYLPERYNHAVLRLCGLTFSAFSNFIVGQCTEACILGTLCFIGMNIFRFPYALLISVVVTFMALIPILGAFFSNVIGALLICIVSPIQAVWFVIFFVVLQQLEGNLIFPHVVGSRVGLPALWVLVAVTIGGNIAGVAGMLISIPLGSVLYVLLRENVEKRLTIRSMKASQNEKHTAQEK